MTWFWYHFIPVDFNTVRLSQNTYCNTNSARISHEYVQNFRNNGLGNFKTLIRNVATQPAMMYYLNNQANTSNAPDENFAREIMELFTLGKDPLSQFTEADVIAAAKILTGWRVQNLNSHPTTTSFVISADTRVAGTYTTTTARVSKLGLSTFNRNQFNVTDGFVDLETSTR
jgi:uncharacterized protein (DUF1800 family)